MCEQFYHNVHLKASDRSNYFKLLVNMNKSVSQSASDNNKILLQSQRSLVITVFNSLHKKSAI